MVIRVGRIVATKPAAVNLFHSISHLNLVTAPTLRQIPVATQSQLPYSRPRVTNTAPKHSSNGAALQQLSTVSAGVSVCIKQISASPEITTRLRELGFCEEQRIKLLSRNSNLICQVCNARLGLSTQLAGLIWVEHVKPKRLAA